MPTGFLGNPTRPSCLLTGLGGLSCSCFKSGVTNDTFFFQLRKKTTAPPWCPPLVYNNTKDYDAKDLPFGYNPLSF